MKIIGVKEVRMKRYGYFLDLLKLDIEKYPVIAVVGGGVRVRERRTQRCRVRRKGPKARGQPAQG